MGVGKRIKHARLKKGLKQAELAEAMGCKQQEISKYEREQVTPRYGRLNALAKALGVPADSLLEEEKEIPEGYVKISDIKEYCDKAAEITLQCRKQEWDVFHKQYDGGAVQLNDLAKACTFFESRYCMYKFDIPGIIDAVVKGDWREED